MRNKVHERSPARIASLSSLTASSSNSRWLWIALHSSASSTDAMSTPVAPSPLVAPALAGTTMAGTHHRSADSYRRATRGGTLSGRMAPVLLPLLLMQVPVPLYVLHAPPAAHSPACLPSVHPFLSLHQGEKSPPSAMGSSSQGLVHRPSKPNSRSLTLSHSLTLSLSPHLLLTPRCTSLGPAASRCSRESATLSRVAFTGDRMSAQWQGGDGDACGAW